MSTSSGFSDCYLIKGFKRHLLNVVLCSTVVDLDGEDGDRIETLVLKPESGETEHMRIFYPKYSAAGVELRFQKNLLMVELEWCGSLGDVMLCFAFLDTVRKKMPRAVITYNEVVEVPGTAKIQLKLTEYTPTSIKDAWSNHIQHMANLALSDTLPVHFLDGSSDSNFNIKGVELALRGIRRNYFFCPEWIQEHWKEVPREEVAKRIIADFLRLQQLEGVVDCTSFLSSIDGSNVKTRTRIIDNQTDYFVADTEKLLVVCGYKMYLVSYLDFVNTFRDHPSIEMQDSRQFVIRRQSEESWKIFCSNLPVQETIVEPDDKNVFLCKWNPQEQFSVQEYLKIKRANPYLRITLPFRDKCKASKGDVVAFVRIGTGNTGLLSVGFIYDLLLDSEEDLVSVDLIKFSQLNNLYYSMKELKDFLPSVDWESDENGICLTEEQCAIFHHFFTFVLHKSEPEK